jgi:hypothetical protein
MAKKRVGKKLIASFGPTPKKTNLFSFVFEYKWIFLFFIIFLGYQVYQLTFIGWDTSVYIEQGKWFCGHGIYFEFIRPPLPGVLNCLFGGADYSLLLTTAFACFVYLGALLLLFSKRKNELNQFIFALFAFIFPSILFNSNFGSDLLALSFLLLAFALDSPLKKGFSFALSSLSRYNFLIFGLVFLWGQRKQPKKILWFLAPVVLVWLPWMIYNYLFTGNPFFSIYESIYLNVVRKGLSAPISLDQIILIGLFALSFFLSKPRRNISDPKNQSAIVMALMFIVSGIKETRFLNLLSPVIAFNAAFSAKKNKKLFVFYSLVVCFMLYIFWYGLYNFGSPAYVSKIDYPTDSFIYNCRVASDNWVFFYAHGIVAEGVFGLSSIQKFVAKGGNVVLYHYKSFDLSGYNVIDRGSYVILKSDSCLPQPKKYISGSLRTQVYKWLKDTNSVFYDYSDWVS